MNTNLPNGIPPASMSGKGPVPFSIRRNTLANYAGTFCQILIGIAFVPLYLHYLGIESYGLIGFSVSLGALLKLTDLGLSSTLSREFARYSVLPQSEGQMRNLLKTLQTLYGGIALAVGLVIAAASPFIAGYWINNTSLDPGLVQRTVLLMGLTTAIQGPMSLYMGGILGLQRHVLGNLISGGLAVLRYGGVVLVLAFFSPTITAFFAYQLGMACIGVVVAGLLLWDLLPPSPTPSRFEMTTLKSVWRFAAGMSLTSVLGLILFQLDKIILIKILPLKMFGYYALASTAAIAVTYLGGPLFTTFLPLYTQLSASGSQERLRAIYRTSCRLNAVLTVPTVVLLVFFSREALLIWTQNQEIADHAYPLLSLLAIGYGLNQLAYLPFALQVAAGWVKLGVYTNAAAVLVIVPALILATLFYGGTGAAVVWIILNSIYVFIYVNVLHSRILVGEAAQWYLGLLLPFGLAIGAGGVIVNCLPVDSHPLLITMVGSAWVFVVLGTILASADLRKIHPLVQTLFNRFRRSRCVI